MDARLNDLLERVRAAQGPDRDLDEAIALALCDEHFFAQLAGAPEDTGCEMYRFGPHNAHSALRVTASIDSALALVERLLNEDEALELLSMVATETSEDTVNGSIKTLPLAIISALLTAIDQKEENK